MAEPVALDPRSYGGTYKLIGGALALDFANLVSYRGTEREHDWLHPLANAGKWVAAAGLDAPIGSDGAQLGAFREVLARTFLAIADGGRPDSADVTRIGEVAAAAWGRRRLEFEPHAGAASWIDSRPSLLAELALDAAALLMSPEALERISACRECRWLFLDRTRNRSRRWCDPADCGNRARQRRHYERSHP